MVKRKTIQVPSHFVEIQETRPDVPKDGLLDVLRSCSSSDLLRMPEVVDLCAALPYSRLWEEDYRTLSLQVTGKTRQNTQIVLYAHVPHYFCQAEHVLHASEIRNAGILSKKHFYQLLDLEDDKHVFVVDYNKVREAAKRVCYTFEEAMKHPLTIPFLGGEERMQRYFDCAQKIGKTSVLIFYDEQLHDEPLCRLLKLDNSTKTISLEGNYPFFYGGTFLSLSPEARELISYKQ